MVNYLTIVLQDSLLSRFISDFLGKLEGNHLNFMGKLGGSHWDFVGKLGGSWYEIGEAV